LPLQEDNQYNTFVVPQDELEASLRLEASTGSLHAVSHRSNGNDLDMLMDGTEDPNNARATADPSAVRLTIARLDEVVSVVPYDDARFLDGFKFRQSNKYINIIFTEYTDIFGRPGKQPTGERRDISQYLQPIENEPSDPLLHTVREWSCWAQGFESLEHEIRWFLTFIFDVCNIGIAHQVVLFKQGTHDGGLF
jgi:hypothetical protein